MQAHLITRAAGAAASLILLCLAAAQAQARISVPSPCYLYWPEGPPNLVDAQGGGGGFAGPGTGQRYLAVATSHYHLELDVLDGRINRFLAHGTAAPPPPDGVALLEPVTASDPAFGRLGWEMDGRRLEAVAAHRQPGRPEFFPVRIIESGPVFQHVALHGLRLDGIDGDFWMEVMAWPDRLRILVKTEQAAVAEALRRLSAPAISGLPGLSAVRPGQTQQLDGRTVEVVAGWQWSSPAAPVEEARVASADPGVLVSADPVEDVTCLVLAQLESPGPANTVLGSPIHAGQSGEYRFSVRNPAGTDARVDLRIELPRNVSITGHSLLLLDAEGRQTGIPVQISKNWHRKELDDFLPYMGPWSHGRVSMVMPPGFGRDFILKLVQGDYGDYHAASIAQLSLVGWGGNGFWIQAALGSWGETVCLQPGRVLRRTLMTDWRPFLSNGIGGGRYNWTANAGGADIFVLFDERGQYVPFVGNRHLLAGYGPCLAQMDFHEVSMDRSLEVRGSWYLPQSDDLARVYLKVRCDVLEDVDYSRFSILQFGADQYNPQSYPQAAFGDAAEIKLAQDLPATAPPDAYLADPVLLTGEAPWISFFGEKLDSGERIGQSQRVVVFHHYKAVLGGEPARGPAAALYNSFHQNRNSLLADVVPPLADKRLRKGDFVEMTLEFILAPLDAESYYGPASGIRDMLRAHANSAAMARLLAAGNQPRISVDGVGETTGPLPSIPFAQLDRTLALAGTRSLVPLTITGVPATVRMVIRVSGNNGEYAPAQQWRRRAEDGFDVVVMLDPDRLPAGFQLFADWGDQ
jgi:hypothetical protein